MHAVSFLGYREMTKEDQNRIAEKIQDEVYQAVVDGYTHFICGLSSFSDQIFVDVVSYMKSFYPALTLEAVFACRLQLNTLNPQLRFHLPIFDKITILSSHYSAMCYHQKNQYLISSDRIIALYNGQKGNRIHRLLTYAKKHLRDLRIISISSLNQKFFGDYVFPPKD